MAHYVQSLHTVFTYKSIFKQLIPGERISRRKATESSQNSILQSVLYKSRQLLTLSELFCGCQPLSPQKRPQTAADGNCCAEEQSHIPGSLPSHV